MRSAKAAIAWTSVLLVFQACAGEDFVATENTATDAGDGGGDGGGISDGPCNADFECNETTLFRCVETARTVVSECATAALCDAVTGTCTAPACAEGEHRCVGAMLVRCNDDRNGFDEIASCVTAALCDASAGACIAPACDVGDYRCTGADLEACTLARTGFDIALECASAADCDANAGACRATCTPNAYQCSNATLLRCNADGTALGVAELCFSAELCDEAAGECLEPVCDANEYDCEAETLRVCNDERTDFEDEETCASPALCSAMTGSCLEPDCEPDQYRCQENVLERCKEDLAGFETAETCEVTEACEESPPGCSDLRDLAGDLHGFTILVPCVGNSDARSCTTAQAACSNLADPDPVLNGAKPTDRMLSFGGERGIVYNVRLRVQGQVESKLYSGGTDQSSTSALPADGFYVGGAPNNSTGAPYNVYAMRVSSPRQDYFFNSIATGDDSRIRSSTFDVDYEAVVRIEGGASLRLLASDPNCIATRNCADPDEANVCNAHEFSNLSSDILDDIVSQPYPAQFVGFLVESVTIER
ncbi:MAG TPA: hypothetical protein VF989_17355 [Polyangiaceae bacterium]